MSKHLPAHVVVQGAPPSVPVSTGGSVVVSSMESVDDESVASGGGVNESIVPLSVGIEVSAASCPEPSVTIASIASIGGVESTSALPSLPSAGCRSSTLMSSEHDEIAHATETDAPTASPIRSSDLIELRRYHAREPHALLRALNFRRRGCAARPAA